LDLVISGRNGNENYGKILNNCWELLLFWKFDEQIRKFQREVERDVESGEARGRDIGNEGEWRGYLFVFE